MQVIFVSAEDAANEEAARALAEKLAELTTGLDVNVVLNAISTLTASGIKGCAREQGISCVGWAYRIADAHAEHIKDSLAHIWADDPPEQPLAGATPAGSC